MKRFKASRIAVREALKSLEAAGLVTIRPGSGVYATEADSKTMSNSLYSILRIRNTSAREMTEARRIFEPEVARLAAERITERELQALKDNIQTTASRLKAGHPVVEENIGFHILIAEATQNTVISLTMKTMLDVAQEMTVVSKETLAERIKVSKHSLAHHKEIVKALERKDPEKVYELMHEHVVRIQKDLKKAMSDIGPETKNKRERYT